MKIEIITPQNFNFNNLKKALMRALLEHNEHRKSKGMDDSQLVCFDSFAEGIKLAGPIHISIDNDVDDKKEIENSFAKLSDAFSNKSKENKSRALKDISRTKSGII